MKVAVIGSRGITNCNLSEYLPEDTDEIVSGGARGIDSCAREYARKNGIKLTEFLPEYDKYGRGAPLRRNIQIIDSFVQNLLIFLLSQEHPTKISGVFLRSALCKPIMKT